MLPLDLWENVVFLPFLAMSAGVHLNQENDVVCYRPTKTTSQGQNAAKISIPLYLIFMIPRAHVGSIS